MKTDDRSPAMALLGHVWRYTRGRGWDILNRSMARAMNLAISSLMRFDRGDFAKAQERLRIRYWSYQDNAHNSAEHFYALAVERGNISACRSFEAWKDRPPFIADGVCFRYPGHAPAYHPDRKRCRLFLGAAIPWKGEMVRITSFAPDGSHVVACSYAETGRYPTKIRHRFRITRQDLLADRRRRKEQKAATPGSPSGCAAATDE